MFRLIYSNQTDVQSKSSKKSIEGFYRLNDTHGSIILHQERQLTMYKYEPSSLKWVQKWNEQIYDHEGNYPLQRYPWIISDQLDQTKHVLLLRHPNGIRIYELDKDLPKLKYLKEDGNFHDVYNHRILLGRFYPNADWIGVMTRNSSGTIEFFAATPDSLNPEEVDPLFPLTTKTKFDQLWKIENTTFFTTKLRHHDFEFIGLRSDHGLEFYQFNADYLLQRVVSANQIIRPLHTNRFMKDYIYFANLSNGSYQDILHFNESGLFVYKYNTTTNDYVPLNQNTDFSAAYGWLPHYTESIHIIDINNDGQDDLVYTGLNGIEAVTFDPHNLSWKLSLNSNNLPASQRYSTIIGALPAQPPTLLNPSLFTLDTEYKLQWAQIIIQPNKTKTSLPVISKKDIPSRTVDRNPKLKSGDIPSQIFRQNLSSKRVLRWEEQNNGNFLKDILKQASAQVNLNIPLMDLFTSDGWNLQLVISYDSGLRSSDLLGEGWSMSLKSNYIFVDYQESVFHDNVKYYLMIQGHPQLLKRISNQKGVDKFEVSETIEEKSTTTIEYHIKEQYWIIENTEERLIYGKSVHPKSESSLQYSLSWPHWHGIGRHKEHLQPFVSAWHLNTRQNKEKNRTLFYYYEIDSKIVYGSTSYTSAIRVKTITDGQELELTFEYKPKEKAEYKTHNPIDGQGYISFPVPLEQSYYLKKYKITTSAYTQTLELNYKVDKDSRLLTSIAQQIQSHTEPVLQFTYKFQSGIHILESCTLVPRELKATFQYERPGRAESVIFKYPIRETPMVTYGSDFSVIAYRNLSSEATKVLIRIMNRELTRIVTTREVNLQKLTRFNVYTFSNSFVVNVANEQEQILFTFDRQKDVWTEEPTENRFTISCLLRFSETVIAAACPNVNHIKLLTRSNNQRDWKLETFGTTRTINYLALHKNVVVFYDDEQLVCFSYSGFPSSWKKHILASNIKSVAATTKKIISSFDISSELHNQILASTESNYLQIVNNLVVLTSLEEAHGQLHTIIDLFLLNSNYEVTTHQMFKVKQENLYEISKKSESKDGTIVYHLGYVREGDFFQVRVKNVSGKHFDDIGNKNLREDAIEDTKTEVNQDSEFLKSAKEYFLLDWSLYVVQIQSNGISCGKQLSLRMTGTSWEEYSLPSSDPNIVLGKSFVLVGDKDNKTKFKLFKQDDEGNKIGDPIQEIQTQSPEYLINRYPAYIAYYPEPELVNVLTFENEKSVGKIHSFRKEELQPESDWYNLITVVKASTINSIDYASDKEFWIRPFSTLVPSSKQLFLHMVELSDGEVTRITAHKHANKMDPNGLSQTDTLYAGNDKSRYGWYEKVKSYIFKSNNVTTIERWYDANSHNVFETINEMNADASEEQHQVIKPLSDSMLMDQKGKWLISDFSPYKLSDEMVSFYGFESYERNQIGNCETSINKWNVNHSKIIEDGFSFTGKNYLQLSSTMKDHAFIEGKFHPKNQNNVYLASCWIRSHADLKMNSPTSYLKANINISGGPKMIEILGQVKNRVRDWVYLELPMDFQLFRNMYENYTQQNSKTNSSVSKLPSTEEVNFDLQIRVEAPLEETVDLDHIRFSPFSHDFQGTVYDSVTGKLTAIIQTNGLVVRNIYNHVTDEIGILQEDDTLTRFSSSSKTGKLVPKPEGNALANTKPSMLTFEPMSGSYEFFDAYSLRNHWKISDSSAWNIAPGQIWHKHSGQHQLQASESLFDPVSSAVRFYFELQESGSSLSLNWQGVGNLELIRESNQSTSLILPNDNQIIFFSSAAELIVMLEQNYIWAWLDGVLLVDQTLPKNSGELTPWSNFVIEAKGKLLVEDLFIMNRPQVKIEYYNSFGEKTQTIQLEDTNNVQVNEVLYDPLGRESITTKTTRISRTKNQPLLIYRPGFVTNKNPSDSKSVWHTGKINGEVDKYNPEDHGVPFIETEYAASPLNQEKVLGFPGPEFSTRGPYSIKLSQYSKLSFLDNLFPRDKGFRQSAETTPNGSVKISIFDKHNNQIGKYVRVPSYKHLLSTYEYDEENRLTKILPPLYHEKVETASKIRVWQTGDEHLSIEEKQLQDELATRFVYDTSGHMVRKITPDTGNTAYLYNSAGHNRFMVSLNSEDEPRSIVYFNYDENGQMISTGYMEQTISMSTLYNYLESNNFPPYFKEHQQFVHVDSHLEPLLRGRIKYFITRHGKDSVYEKVQFTAQEQIAAKSSITLSLQAGGAQLSDIKKEYKNNKLHMLEYPILVNEQPLRIMHSYNRIGQLVGMGTKDEPNYYIKFSYYPTGELMSEQYQPFSIHNFTRNYKYNSPGFLESISDPFLVEQMTYTSSGYGQSGYGDGMIMQTAFKASWSQNSDPRWFQVRENDLRGNFSTVCMTALKRMGYLAENGKPMKLYVRNLQTSLPLVCGGETESTIAQVLAEKDVPNHYGHRYSYGSHQELVRAKYFIDETDTFAHPLQPDSFAKEIKNISVQQSQDIWNLLIKEKFIISNQERHDPSTAVGKSGNSIFRRYDLHSDLAKVNDNYTLFVAPIEQLIMNAVSEKKLVSLEDFETNFLQWQGVDKTSSLFIYNKERKKAKDIGQILSEKRYLPTQNANFTQCLDNKFTSVLHRYTNFLSEIVRVLSQHFAHALGEMPFDFESLKIDANGNHQLFYSGLKRYELTYRNNSNQIEHVKANMFASPSVFDVKHDIHGNMIQALHKGIKFIGYHRVSQRPLLIQLTDGRRLRFSYDSQGERVLKRVYNSVGKRTKEVVYLRDEQGRVLVDRQTDYLGKSTRQIVTAYIYGPRGLVGFVRNNKFYNVTTDHSGSVRLVIDSGRVVAAYDYLPYGQLMRSYGNDPQAHLVYRFTGQEWDEETDLYNYHARLYDPSIGRFYQPDPKSQYFSPYKYAGNSPISTVDPDGEFAFLLAACIILAVGGAYLGGASANNRWNPLDWDYKDSGTWLGIGGGAIAGGLLPVGFVASAGVIGVGATVGLGIGGAYLGGAAANQNWNPGVWKWSRPATWNGLMDGFGAGSGIAGGVGLVHNFAKQGKALIYMSKFLGGNRNIVRAIFLTISYSAAGGVTFASGVLTNKGNFAFWQWDLSNPATWSALLNGFDTGVGWPQNFLEVGRGMGKLIKNPIKIRNSLKSNLFKRKTIKAILKNPQHPLYKVSLGIVMSYFMGSSANNELDITRWNLASFSTYEGVINGVLFGKDTSNLLNLARNSKAKGKLSLQSFQPIGKKTFKKWMQSLTSFDFFRKKMNYQLQMIESFAMEKLWRTILGDKPASLIRDVELFFRAGLEKWRNGETRPPLELQSLMLEAVSRRAETKPKQLDEWQTDGEKYSKADNEVFVDEEVSFLNCHSLSGRQKRQPGKSQKGCSPTSSSKSTSDEKKVKPELIEQFFDSFSSDMRRGIELTNGYTAIIPKLTPQSDGFDRRSPVGFSEHFSLVLEKTPNFLAATKKEFFPSFILGSICTLSNSKLTHIQTDVFVKMENVKIKASKGRSLINHDILKTVFKKNDNTLVLKTFISEDHSLTSNFDSKNKKILHEYYKKELTDKCQYSKSEMEEVSVKLGLKTGYKIEEIIYYIGLENSLSVKTVRSDEKSYKYDLLKEQGKEFETMDSIQTDLTISLEKISTNDIDKVEEGIKELSENVLNIYKMNFKRFKFKETSESAFHAFFYGALSFNFKYRHSLDVYVERIAGRGYADLTMLSRKGKEGNRNWHAIPIVVEFKADKTSSSGATGQTTGTGYLHNLSMRTVAKEAVIVGVNSNNKDIDITRTEIPQSEGLVYEMMLNMKTNKGNIKTIIEKELKHLYYSISPLAVKTKATEQDRYFSRVILGQILARNKVYLRTEGDVCTFVFEERGQWTMMNIVENSEKISKDLYKFNDIVIDRASLQLPENEQINNLVQVVIKINSKSKEGWSLDERKRTVDKKHQPENYYFQNLEVDTLDVHDVKKLQKTAGYTQVPHNFNIEHIFQEMLTKRISFHYENALSMPLKDMVQSESDFQALLHGLFLGINKKFNVKDGSIEKIKVFPEANPSRGGRIDLVALKVKEIGKEVSIKEMVIMELKYSGNGLNDVRTKLVQADEQILKYNVNLKTFTDGKVVLFVSAVFDKNTGNTQYRVHKQMEIDHSSDSDLASQDLTSDAGPSKLNLDEYSDMDVDAVDSDDISDMADSVKSLNLDSDEERPASKRQKPGANRRKRSLSTNGNINLENIEMVSNTPLRMMTQVSQVPWYEFSSLPSPYSSNPSIEETNERSRALIKTKLTKNDSPQFDFEKQWSPSLDTHGLLAWGIILARKWYGYKPITSLQTSSYNLGINIESKVQATNEVNAFMDMAMSQTKHAQIRQILSEIFEAQYLEIINKAQKEIINGEEQLIDTVLYKELIEKHIPRINRRLNTIELDAFLCRVKKSNSHN